jgi:hypothetical protein
MRSIRFSPFTMLHSQPRRRPCPENLEIGSCPRYNFPTHKSPTASKWPGGSNLGAQSTITLLLNALPTPSPYPSFLHLAQARFFDNLEHCNRRLHAWAFVEGFDIVRNGGGTAANPSYGSY